MKHPSAFPRSCPLATIRCARGIKPGMRKLRRSKNERNVAIPGEDTHDTRGYDYRCAACCRLRRHSACAAGGRPDRPGLGHADRRQDHGRLDRTGEANWRIEDGALVADKGKGGHLVTKNSYKNFQINAEFWADEEANSGIFIRCKDPKAIGARTCYEVNIFDKRPDPSYGTGSIVYFAEVNPMPKAAGKWNTFEITADGRHLVVVLNGQKTVDIRNGMFEEGHFTLQYGAGVIKFRKVAVKPL